jgi:hypothetical protein
MRDHGKEARERAHSFLSRHHYSGGEVAREDGGPVSHEHVRAVKAKGTRLASGGSVPALKDGGEHKGKKEGGGGHHIGAVNIAIGNPEKEQQAKQQGIQAGMQAGMQKGMMAARGGAGGPPPGAGGPPPGPPPGAMPPRPPMAGPPPGAMPPGGAPPGGPPPGAMPPRPPGVKDGGMIHVREHTRRKGGSVPCS